MSVGSIDSSAIIPQYNHQIIDDSTQVENKDGLNGAGHIVKQGNKQTGINHVDIPQAEGLPHPEEAKNVDQPILVKPGKVDVQPLPIVTQAVLVDAANIEKSHTRDKAVKVVKQFLQEPFDHLKCSEKLMSVICEAQIDSQCSKSTIAEISKDNFKALLSTLASAQIERLVNLLSDKTTHQKIPTLAHRSCESMNESDPAGTKSAVSQLNGCYQAFLEGLAEVAAEKNIPSQKLNDLKGCTDMVGMAPQGVVRFVDNARSQTIAYFDRDCQNLLTNMGQINSLDMASTIIKDLRSQLIEVNALEHPDHQAVNDSLSISLAKQIKSFDDKTLAALFNNLQGGEYYLAINGAPSKIENEDDAIRLVFVAIHNLVSQEMLERAAKTRKSDHIYGLDKLDYEVPSYSGWERFGRLLANFFKKVFTLGLGKTQSLEREAIIAKTRQFANENGELFWQLKNEGYSGRDILIEVRQQLIAHGWNLSRNEINLLALEMSTIMVDGLDNYYLNRYKGLTSLPADDPRATILNCNMIELAAANHLDLSGLTGKEQVTLKEGLLLTLNSALEANPQADFRAISRDFLERAATRLANERLGLVPPKPETCLTNEDHAQILLHQVGRGIPSIQTMLVAATNFAATVRSEAERVYEEAKLNDPNTPAISEGQLSSIRRDVLKKQLAGCSSEQLLVMAKEVNRASFNYIKQGVVLANGKYGVDGQVGNLATRNCRAAEAAMDDLFQTIKAEVEERQLVNDLSWQHQLINTIDESPPRVAHLVGLFAKDANEVAVGEFGQRALGILDSIKNNTFTVKNEISRLLTSFVVATGFDGSAAQMAQLPAFFEQTMLQELHGLKGSEVLELFRNLCKPEALQYRLSLAASTQADDQLLLIMLNSIEGGVQMEIAERALVADKSSDLTGGQVAILASAEKKISNEFLANQSDEYLKTGSDEELKELTDEEQQVLDSSGITKAEFEKVIAESELTININGEFIYGNEPVFADKDGNPIPGSTNLKNIFELDPEVKGERYLKDRLLVEHAFSLEMAKMDEKGIDPSNHPISAAINVGRGAFGAAPMYSEYNYCFLVLKDEVKKRATYSADDSFYSISLHLDSEKFEAELTDTLAKIKNNPPQYFSENLVATLTDKNIAQMVRIIIDSTVNHDPPIIDFGMGTDKPKFAEYLTLILKGNQEIFKDIGEAKIYDLCSEINQLFGKETKANFTSFSHMEKLLPHLSAQQIDAIKTISNEPDSINVGTNYIECQVFGGIDIARDVKEIVINGTDISKAQIEKTLNFAKKLGVPVRIASREELGKDKLELKEVKPIAVPPEISKKDDSMKSFKEDFMSILDLYAQHELTFDPQSIHGRAHICRVIIYANAWINYLSEKGLKIDRYGLMRAIALHDAGRKRNGPDVYEGDSKAIIKQVLTQGISKSARFGDDGKLIPEISVPGLGLKDENYVDKIAGLVLGNVPTDSIEGIILHSVDSVDIVRVTGVERFDRTKMEFGNHDIRQGDTIFRIDHGVREQMIEEARILNDSVDLLHEEQEQYTQAQDRYYDGDENARRDIEASLEAMKEKSRQITNEQYFAAFEQEILQHPEKYPFLAKYYKAE